MIIFQLMILVLNVLTIRVPSYFYRFTLIGGVVPPPSGYGTSTYSCRVEIGRYFRFTELRYQLKNWSNRVTGSVFTAVRGFS